MNVKITGKNIEITDAIRDYIEKKVEKLEKLEGKNTDISVTCSTEREQQIIEIIVNSDGDFIKISESNEDLYASVDLVIDKVERQMRKEKEKKFGKGKNESIKDIFANMFRGEAVDSNEITKTKTYEIKPITVEDAKLILEEKRDMFLTFLNIETNQVNVLYRREDGSLGIVVPEN
jgi:putative sigma-54 modulation protein